MTFLLIITFWSSGFGQSWSPAYTSQLLPIVFQDKASCDATGEAAKANFNGGGNINWTCVPTQELDLTKDRK